MTKRIAVASSDGKVVNQHFGWADKFYIIDAHSREQQIHRKNRRNGSFYLRFR